MTGISQKCPKLAFDFHSVDCIPQIKIQKTIKTCFNTAVDRLPCSKQADIAGTTQTMEYS